MSGDSDQQLKIILDQLARLLGLPPPPMIPPTQLASAGSAIDNLLQVLTEAGGIGVPGDNADAQKGQVEREGKINDALAKFPANEEQSAARLASVSQEGQMAQMSQQAPQMASGIAGGIAGALGGALQPLSQIPQQIAQASQQATQIGMGALQHGAESGAGTAETVPDALLGGDGGLGGGTSELADTGGGGTGALGGTMPTAMLGPPPTPSAGTYPASSPTTPVTPPRTPGSATPPSGGMTGMPMVPPGAMCGTGGTGRDAKVDTKRLLVPSVKNGAPVQGRIITPPPTPEVTKRVEGKPIATRRIVLPDNKKRDDNTGSN